MENLNYIKDNTPFHKHPYSNFTVRGINSKSYYWHDFAMCELILELYKKPYRFVSYTRNSVNIYDCIDYYDTY